MNLVQRFDFAFTLERAVRVELASHAYRLRGPTLPSASTVRSDSSASKYPGLSRTRSRSASGRALGVISQARMVR